jgi:dienelactone hydrolase
MRALVVASLLLVGCSSVSLKSTDAKIAGTVGKPDGNGPFPALVLLHGCGGPQPGNALWATELNKWGYATMEVDSFFGRGVREICTNLNKVTVSERVVDAYMALDHLRTLSFVDKDRIGVMGWSHGAMVVQSALRDHRRFNEPRFKTGVAMYPWCDRVTLYAPMLVIVGSADDWTPSSRCSVYQTYEKVELHIYDGIWHSFDNPGSMRTYLGHQLGYSHEATMRARKDVKDFLARTL